MRAGAEYQGMIRKVYGGFPRDKRERVCAEIRRKQIQIATVVQPDAPGSGPQENLTESPFPEIATAFDATIASEGPEPCGENFRADTQTEFRL